MSRKLAAFRPLYPIKEGEIRELSKTEVDRINATFEAYVEKLETMDRPKEINQNDFIDAMLVYIPGIGRERLMRIAEAMKTEYPDGVKIA